jgi:ferredoxin-NADP reductase/nitrite reductase/ring-hydroxylating ferredoxin subunit
MFDTARTRWHPIAASSDLPFRHIFHGQLLGRELAVWRADDGYVNVWENRCLHRGLRLSIGISDGRELKCLYHGWRYSNRTAGCTYIPAHPADAPARTITNRTFPGIERYGLVWSAEQPQGNVPRIGDLEEGNLLPLRGIPVKAPADVVFARLSSYRFQPSNRIEGTDAKISAEALDDFSLALCASESGERTRVVLFVQPVDSNRSVIRGIVDGKPQDTLRLAVLRHHNERLSRLRDMIEHEAAGAPESVPLEVIFEPVSLELAEMPEASPRGRKAGLRVEVARKWQAAEGIAGFELRPIKGLLPTFLPGAHIDVHMPNGLIRQYSIINGTGESASYVIGVKRDADSKGGSVCMHEAVRQGDVLAISEPRNNFPLRRDAVKTVLVAGGIGVTPLLAMAQTLKNGGLVFELHYFMQSDAELAFPELLKQFGESLKVYVGLPAEATNKKVREILTEYRDGMQVYLCGPPLMLDAARRIAAETSWPEAAVHFEYFKNANKINDSSSFEVALARSGMTLKVPSGKTILEVMREAGIDMPSSCEQGACGTCVATVIEGEVDHQDVYLSATEHRSNAKMTTCVSRAKSARLVLDL